MNIQFSSIFMKWEIKKKADRATEGSFLLTDEYEAFCCAFLLMVKKRSFLFYLKSGGRVCRI
ncbi:hypothetical protein ABE28_000235 [Peribacillus muralis]|uniref:Uncharacterized protein n=1 Tax=Peribacillus muralis TaxID=264697 RepID=A0A1B3XHX5_9BACI|nr:hypothetical protein ABE28_000235 [Peribacillus muralis]